MGMLFRQVAKRTLRDINRLTSNSALSITKDNKRVAHYHIQKCGGSSINHAFYQLAFNNRTISRAIKKNLIAAEEKQAIGSRRGQLAYQVANRTILLTAKNGDYVVTRDAALFRCGKASYIHGHNLPLRFLDQPDVFSFSVLRDPVERVISRYRMDLALSQENSLAHYGRQAFGEFITNPEKYFDYLRKTEPLSFYSIISTFSRRNNLDEASENLSKIDWIMWQDNLSESFEKMVSDYSILLPYSALKLARAKDFSNILKDIPVISDSLKSNLRDQLHIEYQLIDPYAK